MSELNLQSLVEHKELGWRAVVLDHLQGNDVPIEIGASFQGDTFR